MTPEQFADVYMVHHSKWLDLMTRLTRSRDVAEDVVHNVMEMMLKRLDRLDPTRNVESYIRDQLYMYVLRYVWPNHITKHTIDHNTVPLDALADTRHEAYVQDMPLDKDPIETALEQALSTLSQKEADIVVMAAVGEWPWKEIARVVGVTPDAARKTYVRALPKLRAALAHVGIAGRSCVGNTGRGRG